jgi:hypothetical protein
VALVLLDHSLIAPPSLPDEVLQSPDLGAFFKGDRLYGFSVSPAKQPS